MEYVYAALALCESGEEIDEANLTAVLDAAGASVRESRTKALVAALEDVDVDEVDALRESAGLIGEASDSGAGTDGRPVETIEDEVEETESGTKEVGEAGSTSNGESPEAGR